MSQRASEYVRMYRDVYQTPEWVTEAVIPHLPSPLDCIVWEPAAGGGKMSNVLKGIGYDVWETDIEQGVDFITSDPPEFKPASAIVTNPPFYLAREFIERALSLSDFVAMLLRTDYDHAKTRRHLFADCKAFAKKVVLTKRIVWFERPGAAPSFNHAWFIWDKRHKGPPTLAYGP